MTRAPWTTAAGVGRPGATRPGVRAAAPRRAPLTAGELAHVVNAFDPWARDRGDYYALEWKPRAGAESGPAFATK